MADGDKEPILVLPKQFFVDAFLAERGTANVRDYIEQNHYLFITNVIIEVSASFSVYNKMAVTTSTALDEFDKLLTKKPLTIGSEEILMILKGLTHVVETPSINKLGSYESMIAIADRLYVSSDYEPVIVVNPLSRESYKEAAEKYYGDAEKQEIDPLAFKFYDPRQTKAFLETKYPYESEQAIKRTPSMFRVFD